MVNEPDIVIGRLKEHTLYNLEAYYYFESYVWYIRIKSRFGKLGSSFLEY